MERPFRDVKERFLEECNATGAPASLAVYQRARIWLGERIHSRLHRGIGAIPAERLAAEVPLLGALPRRRFDTAYVEARRVHVAIPQIEWRGVRYGLLLVGQRVEVRQEVGGSSIEIRWASEHVATHAISEIEGMEVWDAGHFAEAQSVALSLAAGTSVLLAPMLLPPSCRCASTSRETSRSKSLTWPAMRPGGPSHDRLAL